LLYRAQPSHSVLPRPVPDRTAHEAHLAVKRSADAMDALEIQDHAWLASILRSGPLKPGGGRDLLDRAIQRGDFDVLVTLERVVDADGIEPGQSDAGGVAQWVPLVSAACSGHRDVVSTLLWLGADLTRTEPPRFAGWPATTALAAAVLANRTTVVDYLIDHGPYRQEMLWPAVKDSAARRNELAEAAHIAALNNQPAWAVRLRAHLADAEADAMRRAALWAEPTDDEPPVVTRRRM